MFTIQVQRVIDPTDVAAAPNFGIIYSPNTRPNTGFGGQSEGARINQALDAGFGLLYLHGATFVSVDHRPIPMEYMIPAANGYTNCILVREGLSISDFLLDVIE
jgi:hypothetical protein